MAVGPNMTCVFENHDTVLLQIQEMLRTERITREPAILHEIETYNELVPGDSEVSATIMIEIDDKAERDAFLVRARGIEKTITLGASDVRAAGRIAPSRDLEDRASAVLYVKFALPPELARKVKEGAPITLRVAHEAYAHEAALPEALVKSLAEDLAS
jgi:hypothetical protein